MRKQRSILISQPRPEAANSPYFELEKKYNVKFEFRKFFKVTGVAGQTFRKDKINITDYTAIILNSRNSIDHLFRICEELRIKLSQETKFFCNSEAIALYLQKYTQYRKRKVFFSSDNQKSLYDLLLKHKDERFLWPCTDVHTDELPVFLEKNGFNFDKAVLYKNESNDLTDFKDLTGFEAVVLFSPAGVKSLFENFPTYEQGEQRIGTMGANTAQAAKEAGLRVDIIPSAEGISMITALDNYLKASK
jgi:uroporphyrinogen-III synthase